MIDQIDAKFHVKRRHGIVYSWGDTIYNPDDVKIVNEIMAHEVEHGRRQRRYRSIEFWWEMYIASPSFRLDEEIGAHIAEYQTRLSQAVSRQERRAALKITAQRLAAPLYGHLITVAQAKKVIAG